MAANQLGYDPLPQKPDDLARLEHYTRMEAVAARQILDLGFILEDGGKCPICSEGGRERHGIHIEKETTLFKMVGHLDRRLIIQPRTIPVEIKSLGPNSFSNFRKTQFKMFPGYEFQECCYLEVEQSPGLYWCMNRDTGEHLSYLVNDIHNEISLKDLPPDTSRLTLSVTFDRVVDKVNQIEIEVQSGTLPAAEESAGCWFCRYKFLCNKESGKEKNKVVDDSVVIEAANNYKEAIDQEKAAVTMKNVARDTLIYHAKKNSIDKYRCAGVSVSYRGARTKKWLDETTIRKGAPEELIRLAERESAPYDDATIKKLKDD